MRVNLDVGEELGLPGAQIKYALDELGRQVVPDRVGEQPQLGVLQRNQLLKRRHRRGIGGGGDELSTTAVPRAERSEARGRKPYGRRRRNGRAGSWLGTRRLV